MHHCCCLAAAASTSFVYTVDATALAGTLLLLLFIMLPRVTLQLLSQDPVSIEGLACDTCFRQQ
jgi:hypothetical protein